MMDGAAPGRGDDPGWDARWDDDHDDAVPDVAALDRKDTMGRVVVRSFLIAVIAALAMALIVALIIVFSGAPQVGNIPVVDDPEDGKRIDGKTWWRADVVITAGSAGNATGGSDCWIEDSEGPFTVATDEAEWTVRWDSSTFDGDMECRDLGPGSRIHLMGFTTDDGDHLARGKADDATGLEVLDWGFPLWMAGFAAVPTFVLTLIVTFITLAVRRSRRRRYG